MLYRKQGSPLLLERCYDIRFHSKTSKHVRLLPNHDTIDRSDDEEDTVQVWRLPGFASRETTAGISRRWTSPRSFTMLAEEYPSTDTLSRFTDRFRKPACVFPAADDTELIKSSLRSCW